MQIDDGQLYRVRTVAQLMDVSRSTVYRAIESGQLDVLRIGKALRVPGTAFARWWNACGGDQPSAAGPARSVRGALGRASHDGRVVCLGCAEEFDPDFSPDIERCLDCTEQQDERDAGLIDRLPEV